MKGRDRLLIAAVIGFAMPGCMTWVEKGDALFHESDGRWEASFFPKPIAPWHRLRLPPVSIDRMGETVVRVRDLPIPLCPSTAELEMPEDEARDWVIGQPWRAAIFEVIIRRLDGSSHYSSKVALSQWGGVTGPGSSSSRRRISIQIGPWGSLASTTRPMLRNYDVVVRVLTPSPRKGDRLYIAATTPFQEPDQAPEPTPPSVTPRASEWVSK
jgi:hypothetical protein